MKIKELGETGFINRIKTMFTHYDENIVRAIGEDTAVIRLLHNRYELLTVDTFVEGIHFDFSFTSPRDTGKRCMGAALSDIAAMGGIPTAALVSISISPEREVNEILNMYRGIKDYALRYNCPVAGGETTSTKGPIVIAITIRGETHSDQYLTRSGANPYDEIYVTGTLGDSRAGLESLSKNLPIPLQYQKKAFLKPVPRIHEARFLLENIHPTSAIDLSDGLSTDLGHLCDESTCGACIRWDAIPLSSGTKKVAELMNVDPQVLALNGGEDFELLLTTPHNIAEKISEEFKERFGIPLTKIGEILKDTKIRIIVMPDGNEMPLKPSGYDHFNRV